MMKNEELLEGYSLGKRGIIFFINLFCGILNTFRNVSIRKLKCKQVVKTIL